MFFFCLVGFFGVLVVFGFVVVFGLGGGCFFFKSELFLLWRRVCCFLDCLQLPGCGDHFS